jgi:hypothetical protein
MNGAVNHGLTNYASIHLFDRGFNRQNFLDKETPNYTCRNCFSPEYSVSLNMQNICPNISHVHKTR